MSANAANLTQKIKIRSRVEKKLGRWIRRRKVNEVRNILWIELHIFKGLSKACLNPNCLNFNISKSKQYLNNLINLRLYLANATSQNQMISKNLIWKR